MADDEAYSSLSDITSDFEYDDGESEVTDDEVVEDEDVSMDGVSDHKSPSKPRGGRRATGTKKTAKKSKKEKGSGYTIKDALKAPRATTYTAQALFDQIVSGDIDLDPEYQRDVVWPEAKQVGLIDSIFRNFYIPPVIFAVSAHDDGSEHRVCIDGKQRLTSIYRFMLGLVYHRDRKTSEKLWYQDSSSGSRKSRALLPDKYRRLFANKQIVCVEYMDISDKDEREIFQRVQLGMALTPAEKLGVLKSPRADFIRHLQSTFFKDADSALTSLSWDRSRGTDFRCLATILWCIDRYWQSPRLLANTGTIQQLETYLNSPNSVSAKFKSSITAGFTTLQSMLTSSDPNITLPFRLSPADMGVENGSKTEKVSPIEFICICLLVLVWRTQLGLKGMAKAITAMRRNVRSEHVDVRMNTRVGKTMLTFLKELRVEDYDEDDDPSGVDGMAQDREEGELTPASKKSPTKAKTKSKTKAKEVPKIGPPSKKRKRPVEVEDPHDSAGSDATPTPTSPKSSKSTTVNKSRLAGIRKATQQLQARPGE